MGHVLPLVYAQKKNVLGRECHRHSPKSAAGLTMASSQDLFNVFQIDSKWQGGRGTSQTPLTTLAATLKMLIIERCHRQLSHPKSRLHTR